MREVIADLERVRHRGRLLLLAQRLSVLAASLLAVAVALIALDFLLRFPGGVRLVLLVAGLGALGHVLWRYIRPAVRFHPSLTHLALRAEQTLPGVAGRLASSVEFAASGLDQSNPLAARSIRETERRLAGESVASLTRPGRTIRDLAVFLLASLIVTVLVVENPSTARTGVTRLLLPLSGAQWPARTAVASLMSEVLGANAVHPRGQALPLRARNLTPGGEDEDVDAVYRLHLDDGSRTPWRRIVLTHQGGGVHERLVDTSARAIECSFETADAHTEVEWINLVPPPAVRRASLTVTPPAYASGRFPELQTELGPGTDTRAVTDQPSLVGSQVRLRLELNKPLPVPESADARTAWIADTFAWEGPEQPGFAPLDSQPEVWSLSWRLARTRTLNLNLIDEHGLANSEAIVYRIQAQTDRVPSVTITEPQADEAVLPTAVVSLTAEAEDDVLVRWIGQEAHISRGGVEPPEEAPAWSARLEAEGATATIQESLDLATLSLASGDVVQVTGVAQDEYEVDGQAHPPARSTARRLRIISELELASMLRQQLAAVRQNAIRIEAQQAELQDDVIEDGVQPGVDRAQALIGERIAGQRDTLRELRARLDQNRLDDAALRELVNQSSDLLDYAGRAVNEAAEAIDRRAGARREAGVLPEPRETTAPEPDDRARPERPPDDAPEASPDRRGADTPPDVAEAPAEDPFLREPAEADRPIVEAQQQVRDELADLIELLDRDEDTWVVTRQLESLAEEQAQLEAETARLSEHTIGRERGDLSEAELTELDRIAARQRELAEEARRLVEQMRDRAEALEDADPQAASGMRSAADTGEQRELDRDMERAAERAGENQLRSAAASQQSARRTLQQMLQDIQESKRARAEQLLRQLASLIESIERLIAVQENELIALARAGEAGDYSGRDRSMIRLNQNTQAVAGEARAAGQQARRIARTLDRAADAQGAAVAALRARPVEHEPIEEAETRSLDLLKEAKELAEALQEDTQEEETARQREELMERYRAFLEQQTAVRTETMELAGAEELDRRQLVTARRMGNAQDEIRTGLRELRETTREITDAPVFTHVHQQMDRESIAASELLWQGRVGVEVTDRQALIADSLSRLIEALEELNRPPEEFAEDSAGGGGQGSPPELIPPIAELRLLRGVQEQVYHRTRQLDERTDLDAGQRRQRLRELGQQQRDLRDLGQQMLEKIQNSGSPPPPSEGAPQ